MRGGQTPHLQSNCIRLESVLFLFKVHDLCVRVDESAVVCGLWTSMLHVSLVAMLWISSCHLGRSVTEVIFVRCWFLHLFPREEEHTKSNFLHVSMDLNHTTLSPELCLSSGHLTARRAALLQNYLSAQITSALAILLTSAPDDSLLLTVVETLGQFITQTWTLHAQSSSLHWQTYSAILPAKSHCWRFVTSNSFFPPSALWLVLIKAQRPYLCWFDGKMQLDCTSGWVMWASFLTNDLGALAFIGLFCLACCGISWWTFRVIYVALNRLDQITRKAFKWSHVKNLILNLFCNPACVADTTHATLTAPRGCTIQTNSNINHTKPSLKNVNILCECEKKTERLTAMA